MTIATCPYCGTTFTPISLSRIIDKAVIVTDTNGQYRVKAKSSNGETVLISEQYENLEWARQVAADLQVPVTEGEA